VRLRVVLLQKIAIMNRSCYNSQELSTECQGPWITLGHFDAMYTYNLDTSASNTFASIQKNNERISQYNSGSSYFHPLYLPTEQDDSDFWSRDNWCMAIIRVHYASSANITKLHDNLMNLLPADAKEHGCFCHIYRTMELCDLVVAVKADRISSILEFALKLRKYSCVGKVYTYCGIDYKLV